MRRASENIFIVDDSSSSNNKDDSEAILFRKEEEEFRRLQSRRHLYATLAILCMITIVGVPIGYATIAPVFIDAGLFRRLCKPDEESCTRQVVGLNNMFNIAMAITSLSSILQGFVVEMIGLRNSALLSGILVSGGYLLFAAAAAWWKHAIPLFYVAYTLMTGGAFQYLASMELNVLFGEWSALYIGILVGCWEASSAVFYLFRVLYYHAHLSLQVIFAGFGVWCALLCGACFVVLPDWVPRPPQPPQQPQASTSTSTATERRENPTYIEHVVHGDYYIFATADEATWLMSHHHHQQLIHQHHIGADDKRSQRRSWLARKVHEACESLVGIAKEFVVAVSEVRHRPVAYALAQLFAISYVSYSYFYIGNVIDELTYVAPRASQSAIRRSAAVFSILLPTVGLLATAGGGVIYKYIGAGNHALLTTFIMGAFTLTSNMHVLALQYFSFVALVTFRAFFWLVITKFIYSHDVFPRQNSTLLGLLITVSGAISFLNYYFTSLTIESLHRNFFPVNLGLAIASAVSGLLFGIYCLLVMTQRRPRRGGGDHEAEGEEVKRATTALLPPPPPPAIPHEQASLLRRPMMHPQTA